MTAAAMATIATVEAATSTRWLLPDGPRRKLGRKPRGGGSSHPGVAGLWLFRDERVVGSFSRQRRSPSHRARLWEVATAAAASHTRPSKGARAGGQRRSGRGTTRGGREATGRRLLLPPRRRDRPYTRLQSRASLERVKACLGNRGAPAAAHGAAPTPGWLFAAIWTNPRTPEAGAQNGSL